MASTDNSFGEVTDLYVMYAGGSGTAVSTVVVYRSVYHVGDCKVLYGLSVSSRRNTAFLVLSEYALQLIVTYFSNIHNCIYCCSSR
jgi:hypothetical protein